MTTRTVGITIRTEIAIRTGARGSPSPHIQDACHIVCPCADIPFFSFDPPPFFLHDIRLISFGAKDVPSQVNMKYSVLALLFSFFITLYIRPPMTAACRLNGVICLHGMHLFYSTSDSDRGRVKTRTAISEFVMATATGPAKLARGNRCEGRGQITRKI